MADLSTAEPLLIKTANVALVLDGSLDIAAISRKVPWVGGKISLFAQQLMFVPHRAEAALLPTDAIKDFGIEIASISSLNVESRFGMKTIVIQLKNSGPRVGIRCRGAAQFAATIESLTHLTE